MARVDIMKVAVCCKAVPESIKKVKLNENKGTVECESSSLLMNECDEYALDAALIWKKEQGADVTVLTMGSIRSQDILYMALAKGADRAFRLDVDVNESGVAAQVIAEAVKGKDYDLIITGVESEDNMASQVAISLAERLGLPYALAVTKVEFLKDRRIKVAIEIGGGVQEELEITLPAVLAIQSGIATHSYTALAKVMRARKTPIRSMSVRELGLNWQEIDAYRPKIIAAFDPPQAEYAEMISGSLDEMAEKIVRKIEHVLG
jgi:electron transfer flavoprotein beta subunit